MRALRAVWAEGVWAHIGSLLHKGLHNPNQGQKAVSNGGSGGQSAEGGGGGEGGEGGGGGGGLGTHWKPLTRQRNQVGTMAEE